MPDRSVVLLTGATGFLGTELAQRLIADTACTLVALVRADDDRAAALRLERAWWEWPDLQAAIGERVQPLAGDVTEPGLGLDAAALNSLQHRLTHIIHVAAKLRLEAPLDELRRTNVVGTQHVLELARAANSDHGLQRLAYVSTAYVCGKREGPIEEASFTDSSGFSTAYERSKFEAEALVRAVQTEVPISIFRPGMIVGNSTTGAIKTFNTVYVPLRLFLNGKLPLVPTSPSLRLNIVPVDYVAECVRRLTFDVRARGLTFHLVPPSSRLPTAGDLLDAVRSWAANHLDVHLMPAVFIDVMLPDLPGIPEALRVLQPYLHDRQEFRRDNLDRLLGTATPEWREYLPRLLEYATSYGFLNRSERTACEQVIHRLSSPRSPVRYHDITSRGIITRDSAEVHHDMLTAVAALRTMGVQPGDRVAIVGSNSSRYLTLEVAIGLLGAVSVPLYPTSPPVQIDALLEASAARVLLVGAPGVLSRLAELRCHLPMVVFGPGPRPVGLPETTLDWESFLSLGAHPLTRQPELVRPGDLATLRYTSGTTGAPKAAAFHHTHLRWMAETMAGLVPWQARTRRAAYLSFLPMNHVVEGMLATYGAHYLPVPIDMYFLEDFHALPAALRTVRPTVFFGVPRVYEKIWESVQKSPVGRWYLAAPPGPLKRVAGRVVRRAILGQAGLGHCVQLIVGSAPVSQELLRSFQQLGIEVHTAYGLTEAPLVTLNRFGANRLGTVGQALPETQLSITADDEVLVRGPQVMSGYDGGGEQPFSDGWLLTGDLGHMTLDGSLVIDGRKKELIATAYGKKVYPERVETLLRQIPGVTEAMLVGERRPFCAALVWTAASVASSAIADGISWVNSQLSHAEQVKRWRVLQDDLSAEHGELTPTLKLRRAAVAARYAGEIEALYAEARTEVAAR
jgi:long-chain acyl-CoA synthetase